jgi:hypothetical protein
MNKFRFISIFVVVLLFILAIILFKSSTVVAPSEGINSQSPSATPSPSPSTLNGKITIVGTIACLPKIKNTQPQTSNCAIGLKTEESKYYKLNGIDINDFIDGKISTGMKLTITGEVTSAKDAVYDIIGIIKVTNYK